MTGFTFLSRLTQIAPPPTRFVFLGAGIRLGLPSHPASRRRSCLRLGVSITSSSRGLSPPSDRPCRAYSRAAPAAPLARRQRPALGGPPAARRATHAAWGCQINAAHKSRRPGCVQLPCLAPDAPASGHCVNGRAYLRLQTAGLVRTTATAVGTRNTSCVLTRYKKAVPFDCPKYMRQRPASGLRSAAIWLLVQLTVASSAPHVVTRKPSTVKLEGWPSCTRVASDSALANKRRIANPRVATAIAARPRTHRARFFSPILTSRKSCGRLELPRSARECGIGTHSISEWLRTLVSPR